MESIENKVTRALKIYLNKKLSLSLSLSLLVFLPVFAIFFIKTNI